jgi:hypothetical protein
VATGLATSIRLTNVAMTPVAMTSSAAPDLFATDREAAVTRAQALFVAGVLSYRVFSRVLDEAFAALDHADLMGAISTLPLPIRLTPPAERLSGPLLVRAAERARVFGRGWQVAAETTVATGTGLVEIDLADASWNAPNVHLHLETWGNVEILVPDGVAVQVAMASVPVHLEPLALSAPGAPALRLSALGPTGVIRVSNPRRSPDRSRRRWRRARLAGGRRSNP